MPKMTDYKETTFTGHKWHRFNRIVIENPLSDSPSVACVEQEVVVTPDGLAISDVGNLSFAFNTKLNFPLEHPTTGAALTVPQVHAMDLSMQAYVLVHSYVMYQAKLRDALSMS